METQEQPLNIAKEIELSFDEEPPSSAKHEQETMLLIQQQKKSYHSKNKETIATSARSLEFLSTKFSDATEEDWSDWHWQIRKSVKNTKQLEDYLTLSVDERKTSDENYDALPLRITPYYLSLLDKSNAMQPLRRSVVPVYHEFLVNDGEASDPLSEHGDSPVSNLVHRYPDRALFLVTGFCSTYCRYCTRSHMVAKEKCHQSTQEWEKAFMYLENHPEVRDVIISGGDPLTMADEKIEYLLSRLRSIPHIEIIRIGTKVPVVLPQRITKSLVKIIQKYHPVYLSIHFTHPDEITPEVKQACERLANAGVPLGSQTVLLKGINDNVETMRNLMHSLLKIRVRPYYLYQCDPILGSSHFRTPVEKGLEIIEGLRGHTSGYAIPHYVIDAPGGGGKIPLLPEYYVGRDCNNVILRNYENRQFKYPDYID